MNSIDLDCSTCAVRGPACADCVVSVLLGMPGQAEPVLLDAERAALQALADGGLLPPLRLVRKAAS